MSHYHVVSARHWLADFEEKLPSANCGDHWYLLDVPLDEGGEGFDGLIVMNGVEGDTESRSATFEITPADANLAELICDLFNRAPDHVFYLLEEIDRLRDILVEHGLEY